MIEQAKIIIEMIIKLYRIARKPLKIERIEVHRKQEEIKFILSIRN
jgi:hypothetical protein